jgi:hypothetical protein
MRLLNLSAVIRLSVLATVLLLSACSTHQSPMQLREGQQVIYQMDNEQAVFQTAYSALQYASPRTPIFDIDEPVRGYRIRRRSVIDWCNTMLRIFPAAGVLANGETVEGYYLEVSGGGTLLDCALFNRRLYANVQSRLAVLGTAVKVSRLARSTYASERDRSKAESSTPQGPAKTATERLQELDVLKSQGLITEEEYGPARKRILESL